MVYAFKLPSEPYNLSFLLDPFKEYFALFFLQSYLSNAEVTFIMKLDLVQNSSSLLT